MDEVAGAEGVAIHRHAAGGGAEQAAGLAAEAEAHAQVAGEGVGGLDDLGFDQHLAHLDVDLGDEAADVLEAGRTSLTKILLLRSSALTLPRLDSTVCSLALMNSATLLALW